MCPLWHSGVAHKPVIKGTCIKIATQLKQVNLPKQQLEQDFQTHFQSQTTSYIKFQPEITHIELNLLLAEADEKIN